MSMVRMTARQAGSWQFYHFGKLNTKMDMTVAVEIMAFPFLLVSALSFYCYSISFVLYMIIDFRDISIY